MLAGIPGTGIGGMFYVISALLMPVHELFLVAQGKSSLKRWRMIARQSGLAIGVLSGVWLTGWLLGYFVHQIASSRMVAESVGTGPMDMNLVRVAVLASGLVILAVIMCSVQLLGMIIKARSRRNTQ